jgi:hypothetical protein
MSAFKAQTITIPELREAARPLIAAQSNSVSCQLYPRVNNHIRPRSRVGYCVGKR